MTPSQFVEVLDDAIAATTRRRQVALNLRSRVVLGETGAPAGVDDEGAAQYAFTRAQCERMRASVLTAAREDAGG